MDGNIFAVGTTMLLRLIVIETMICVVGRCLRCIQVGRRSVCCPAAQIFHVDLYDGVFNGLHQAALCLARLATTCRGVLIFSSRYTPSRGVAHTSRMPRTSWPHSTLFPDSSNRQSSSPIVDHFALTPDTCIPHLLCRLADVKPLVWAYKFSREIARRMPHFRGEPTVLHPAFAPGGPASVVAHAEGPIEFETPQIVYSEEDERALDAYVRNRGA